MATASFDEIDRKILALLQEDATIELTEIANEVGPSAIPCWHRIQKLKQSGIIRKRVAVLDLPEVMEVYRLSGDTDFLLRISVPSVEHYNTFYKQLSGLVPVSDSSSNFAMERINFTTALPFHYA